jgi:hypothetical protein
VDGRDKPGHDESRRLRFKFQTATRLICPVIASVSEAIHAWYRKEESWIASSLLLLAMTRDTPPRSRRAMRPSGARIVRPKQTEGAGNAGCALHPQSHVQNKKAHEVVTTGSPEQSGIPRAMVLTAYFALSSVIGLSCHRRKRDTSR